MGALVPGVVSFAAAGDCVELGCVVGDDGEAGAGEAGVYAYDWAVVAGAVCVGGGWECVGAGFGLGLRHFGAPGAFCDESLDSLCAGDSSEVCGEVDEFVGAAVVGGGAGLAGWRLAVATGDGEREFAVFELLEVRTAHQRPWWASPGGMLG